MKKLIMVSFGCIMASILTSCSGKSETMNENLITPTSAAESSVKTPPTAAPTVLAKEEIDYTGKKLVALTFDDGPNSMTTPLVLDKLEEYGVVASFFLVGQNVNESIKPVIQRQLDLGCEINNHSWSHPFMNKLTPEEIKKEIQDTDNIIYDTIGVTPKFFRPPFIATNDDMFANIELPFICGIGCNDWEPSVTAEKRAETILKNVNDGDIILLHDSTGNINTVTALDEIIPGLLKDGYAFVTVSKLFELKGVNANVENMIWTNVN